MGVDLAGKSVAITGASSGIGAATAIACAQAGMGVALFARRQDKLEAVRARIESSGGRAIVVVGSVDDDSDCARLIEQTQSAFGSVDAAIANAGYGSESPTHSMPEDDIRAMFETNFYGSLRTLRPALDAMRRQNTPGHLVFVSSCLSKIGIPRYGAYCASKAAQDHFARAMRHELASEGIAVSSVHPIGTRTEFFDEAAKRSDGARLLERGSQRFMQRPETVANAIVKHLRTGRGGEVWTSLPMRLALGASVACPGITDRVLTKLYAKRMV